MILTEESYPNSFNLISSFRQSNITYTFRNLKGCTVELWEWIRIFTPHFTVHVITYPFPFCVKMKQY